MCRVLNKHHAVVTPGAVYIGRGSKWGNPFRIGPDGDRASARRVPATATSCCGSPTRRARSASRGGAP